jgi:hypothetical protein
MWSRETMDADKIESLQWYSISSSFSAVSCKRRGILLLETKNKKSENS